MQIESQLMKLLRCNRHRCISQRAGAVRRLRKRNDVSQGSHPGHQHHESIHAERESAVRRGTVLESLQEEPKPEPCLLLGDAENTEDRLLQRAVVNSDASASQFDPVENEVVCIRERREGVRFECWDVLGAR